MLSYVRLETRRMLRNRRYVVVALGFPAFFYALCTLTGMGAAPDTAIAGTTWGAYFMISMATWALILSAFAIGGSRISVERSNGWLRQLQASPMRPASYLVGKLAAGLLIAAPAFGLMAILAVVFDGVRLDPLTWFQLAGVLLAGSLAFAPVALLIGFAFDTDTAVVATNIVVFGVAVVGGLMTPVESMPGTMADVARWLPSWRLADIGWRLVGGRPQDLVDFGIIVAFGVAFGLIATWRFRATTAAA